MGETSYTFGGKRFKSHKLHKSHIVEALKVEKNDRKRDKKKFRCTAWRQKRKTDTSSSHTTISFCLYLRN